ncbi:DUF7507 domain-containing protein, partial [Flavilitoribacter nigricans]
VNYDIEVLNDGNISIYNVVVTDPGADAGTILPVDADTDGFNDGDTDEDGVLDVGETWLYTAAHTITQDDIDDGLYTNTATVNGVADTNGDGDGNDAGVGDVAVTDSDDETVNAAQDPSIQTTKSFTNIDGNPAFTEYSAVGQHINYEIMLTNDGNVTIYDISVSDPNAEPGSITFISGDNGNGALDVGETWTYTAYHIVTQTDIDNGTVLNVATGSGSADTEGNGAGGGPGDTPVSDMSNEVVVDVFCVDFDLYVFLEGSLIVPQTGEYIQPLVGDPYPLMRTTLNESRLLPGQYSVNAFSGNIYTPPLGAAGQVYSISPWFYSGNEGSFYDSEGMTANADAGYPTTVTDWVLVSLRTDPMNGAEAICQRAALLHSDGHLEFVDPSDCCTIDQTQSYYIVIEHRNHLIVMSHEAVPVVDGTLTYDFRGQQSYLNDPFLSGLPIAQKEVIPGVFAMYAGNSDQDSVDDEDVDITSSDNAKWLNNGAETRTFNLVDYNMDGDVSALDYDLWQANSPKFTSVKRE